MDDIPVNIPAKPKRLFDQLRECIRHRRLAYSTEKTYLHWIRLFILFHNKRHPSEMGAFEVEQFLNHLAVQRHVTANTQKTALNALNFLYRVFLQRPFEGINISLAKYPGKIPVVFSHDEALRVIAQLDAPLS